MAEFEIIGEALDKHSDTGSFTVYRLIGGNALYLCSSEQAILPVDPEIDTRDRSGSGFARTIGSEPVFEAGEYTHFKGELYDVDGVALRTDAYEDNDWWVVYRARDEVQMYARPLGGFTDIVAGTGRQRFRKTNTAHE